MASETELDGAREAGARFVQAVTSVVYLAESDQVVFSTHWGERVAYRKDIAVFRDISPLSMKNINVSAVGIHIDEIDLDINSAGLIAALFPDMRLHLVNSY